MKYAVIQLGYGILGIGETALDAQQDAVEFGADLGHMQDYSRSGNNDGDTVLLRCTDELYVDVDANGGDVMYEIYWSPEGDYADLLPQEDRDQAAWEAYEEMKLR